MHAVQGCTLVLCNMQRLHYLFNLLNFDVLYNILVIQKVPILLQQLDLYRTCAPSVLTQTSCCIIAPPIVLRYLLLLWPLVSKPLVFKHCILFDTTQSDYCVLLCILST